MIPNDENILMYGIKPTRIHIGHTLSIFDYQLKIKDKFKNIVCLIANYHKFSTEISLHNISDQTENMLSTMSSFGIKYYLQSDIIHEYIKSFFILSSLVPLTLLQKILNINYKSGGNNLVKLFYPLLQTLDIMLVSPVTILVSADQIHNIRCANEIITKINNILGREHFVIKYEITDIVIKGLSKSEAKMSTSKDNCIFLDSDYNQIKKQVDRAKTSTDMPSSINDLDKSSEVKNLYNIMALIQCKTLDTVVHHYKDEGFKVFKNDLIELIYNYVNSYRNMNKKSTNIYDELIGRIKNNAKVIESLC